MAHYQPAGMLTSSAVSSIWKGQMLLTVSVEKVVEQSKMIASALPDGFALYIDHDAHLQVVNDAPCDQDHFIISVGVGGEDWNEMAIELSRWLADEILERVRKAGYHVSTFANPG